MSRCTCPKCGAEENHPTDGTIVQVKGLKYRHKGIWYSQCLICSGGYDKIGGTFTQTNHDEDKGWFPER